MAVSSRNHTSFSVEIMSALRAVAEVILGRLETLLPTQSRSSTFSEAPSLSKRTEEGCWQSRKESDQESQDEKNSENSCGNSDQISAHRFVPRSH